MYKQVEIFTDGSCLGNPGPGGYGAILRYKKYEKILSDGYYLTTNNRMELIASIIVLESLTLPCKVRISSDSQYVRQGISEWIHLWKKRSWQTTQNMPVKNYDLWQRLDIVLQKHKVTWIWIKGHSGHLENEYCDKLARTAANNPSKKDEGYKA